MTLAISAVLVGIGRHMQEAAMTPEAWRASIVFRITLPMLMPGILLFVVSVRLVREELFTGGIGK